MKSTAETIEEYIQNLPEDRKNTIKKLRELILKNLPEGYVESFNWGMLTYEIPLERYPITYNKKPLMYIALASQKNYMSLYLTNVYSNKELEAWFKKRFEESGKKLTMGKSCVNFKTIEDLPLDVISEVVAKTTVSDYIANYESVKGKK